MTKEEYNSLKGTGRTVEATPKNPQALKGTAAGRTLQPGMNTGPQKTPGTRYVENNLQKQLRAIA